MKRLILPFVIGLVLALGGATGVVVTKARAARKGALAADSVKRAHAPRPKPDSAKTDSARALAVAGHPGDSATAIPVHAIDSAAHAAATAASATGHATSPALARGPEPVGSASHVTPGAVPAPQPANANPAPTLVPPSIVPVAVEIQQRRLAKVFGAMDSKEAAKVLVQMDDADVRTILGFLSDRQAAAIMGNFPPDRAALISKATLHAARGGKQ
jgi:hypothetical protein